MKKIFVLTAAIFMFVSAESFARMGAYGNDCPERNGEFQNDMGPGGPEMNGPGMGQPGKKGPKGGMMDGPGLFGDTERMKTDLKLTDDQVSKIAAINLKFKKEHLSLQEKNAPKRFELKKALLDESVDLKNVEKILKEMADFNVQRQMLMIKHRIEIESVLTKEQREKARQFSFPGRGDDRP